MTKLSQFPLYLVLITSCYAVQAQFKLPSVPNIGSKFSANSGSQDQLVNQYNAANKDVLDANGKMADALGLKDQANQARAELTALNSGATQGNVSDADKAISDSLAALSDAYKNPPELDAEAKAKFTDGLQSLGKGVVKYVAMKNSVTSFGNSLTTVSPAMLPKLQAGAHIVKTFPPNGKNLIASLNQAVTFAKAHNITVPSDATQALTSSF